MNGKNWVRFGRLPCTYLIAAVSAVGAAVAVAQSNQEAFIAENNAAMEKMMAGMDVKPTGDIDRDFTAMMIPHHEGAIEMAQTELRYGRNEQLRRIAQEIIVDQLQEIAAMNLAIGAPLPPSVSSPTQDRLSATPAAGAASTAHHHHTN